MISAIDLKLLRNPEYIQFMKGVTSIVRSYDPANLKVQPQFDEMQRQVIGLEDIYISEIGSAITMEVTAMDNRRDRAVVGLGLVVNALTYHFNAETAKQAESIKRVMDKYGSGIARENYQAETAIIDNLVADLDSKPEIAAALAALQLQDWKKELQAANREFDDAYMKRTKELGAAGKDTLLAKRVETNNAYYRLRDFINSYYTIYEGSDIYSKTSNEINALIEQYNTMMAGRLRNTGGEATAQATGTPAAEAPATPGE